MFQMSLAHDRNVKGGKARPNILSNYGLSDYYRFYRSEKGVLDKAAFSAIMRECNKALVDEILVKAEEYTLPFGIGRISFRKRKNKAFMANNKIYSTAMIDWKKTVELWESNLHAKRNKIMVRYNNMHTGRYSFRIGMFSRRFKNKDYFGFRYKRSFKRLFSERIMEYNKPKIEAEIAKTI